MPMFLPVPAVLQTLFQPAGNSLFSNLIMKGQLCWPFFWCSYMSLTRSYQLIILCGVALAVYYSVLFAPICFVDDNKLVYFDLPDSRMQDILRVLFSGGGYYRPLLFVTFIIDNYLWMLHESFMHLENVLLHGGNALLLYAVTERLARRTGHPENNSIPFIVALLFVLHPLATESVNWISGRTDPLACLFLLLSLKNLLDWIESPLTGRLVRIQIYYLLACLSKETAVFFIGPAILLVVVLRGKALSHRFSAAPADAVENQCRVFSQGGGQEVDGVKCLNNSQPVDPEVSSPSWRSLWSACRANWLMIASFAISTIIYFALRRYASMSSVGIDRGLGKLAYNTTRQTLESLWFDKIMEVFRSIGFYTKKIFLPWPLNFNIVQVSDWYVLLGLVTVALLVYFCWKRRDVVATLLLSAVLVGSSALLVSVGKLAWTTYAERYLYIPLIFFIPASVLWLHAKIGLVRGGQLFRVIIMLVCGASLITTVQRNLLWLDSSAFYELNYQQAPHLEITIKNHARRLVQDGREAEAKQVFKLLPPKKRNVKETTVK